MLTTWVQVTNFTNNQKNTWENSQVFFSWLAFLKLTISTVKNAARMIETNNKSKWKYQQMVTITKSKSNVNNPIINKECPFCLKFIVFFLSYFFIENSS